MKNIKKNHSFILFPFILGFMGLTMKQNICWNVIPSFTFLQLNKKTLFTQSILQINQINEYKSIVLIKILKLIKKKMKMIDLRDFGLPKSPRSREE